jgi:hypothetical protein
VGRMADNPITGMIAYPNINPGSLDLVFVSVPAPIRQKT